MPNQICICFLFFCFSLKLVKSKFILATCSRIGSYHLECGGYTRYSSIEENKLFCSRQQSNAHQSLARVGTPCPLPPHYAEVLSGLAGAGRMSTTVSVHLSVLLWLENTCFLEVIPPLPLPFTTFPLPLPP